MRRAGFPRLSWRRTIPFGVATLVAASDQITKEWVRTYQTGETIYQVGLFRLVRVHNTGASFGLFPDQSPALSVVAVIGICAVLFVLLFLQCRYPFLTSTASLAGFGLILGGTIGNLADRLRFGSVTDFLDIGVWPAFNVADSAIVVGTILVAYSLVRLARAAGR